MRIPLPVTLAAILAVNISCSDHAPVTKETFVMGTRAEVTIYGIERGEAEQLACEALREMHRIEAMLSTWRKGSEISRLNDSSGGNPVTVSAEVYSILEESIRFSEMTGGAFDITIGPVVALYGFKGGEPNLPTADQVSEALARVGWKKIRLDPADTTVTLLGGAQIDLAGIGKGYAVDRSAGLLRCRGVTDALVNLGGNIYALGNPPGRDSWTIGIRDPEDRSEIVGMLLISDEAVATSGNYENFVVIGDKRYGHIIDPRSGAAVDAVLGVTVIAPSATTSDALSTAMFVMGSEEGAHLLEGEPSLRAVYALPGDSFRFVGDFGDRFRSGR